MVSAKDAAGKPLAGGPGIRSQGDLRDERPRHRRLRLHRLEPGPALLRRAARAGGSSTSTSSPTPATPRTWPTWRATPGYRFVRGDIGNGELVADLFRSERHRRGDAPGRREPRGPLHPGARRSSSRPTCCGTQVLLEAAREFGVKRFLHVSTDEVYGSLGPTGLFTETTPLDPSSPYSASKASADLLALAYAHTFGLAGGGDPLLQQLRALPVPREAHPADDRQRARATSRCRSTATA